jgi:hypothetical protein
MVPAVLPKWHMFTAAGRPMDDGFFFQPNPIGGLWGAPVRDDFLLTNEGVF